MSLNKSYFAHPIKLIKRLLPILIATIQQHTIDWGLKRSKKDKIVFIVPNADLITGGIMSIVNMHNIAKRLFPEKDIILAVDAKYQSFVRYSKVKCDARIINLNYFLKYWINNNCRILFHVWEKGTTHFLNNLKKKELLPLLKTATLNILNQNQDLLPESEKVLPFVPAFNEVTMTVAHKVNEGKEYSFLSRPPIFVGAYYEGANHRVIPYDEKENLCIISPDENKYKSSIIKKLESNGIRCYHEYPIPYLDFLKLLKRAKWSISFGEGWDGYTSGEFLNGGIGFGVYNPNFKRDFFHADNLPIYIFSSYEEMQNHIIERISQLDEKSIFEAVNKKVVDQISSAKDVSTASSVEKRWNQYYQTIKWL